MSMSTQVCESSDSAHPHDPLSARLCMILNSLQASSKEIKENGPQPMHENREGVEDQYCSGDGGNRQSLPLDPEESCICFDCRGLSEPPKLPIHDQIELARALGRKEELQLSVYEVQQRLEFVKESLALVKAEIGELSCEQEALQLAIDSCEDENGRGLISSEKVEKHKRLINLLNDEDSLLNELESTRRTLSVLSISQQAFALQMNDTIDEVYQIHTRRKNFENSCRMAREETIRKNTAVAVKRQNEACTAAIEKYCIEANAMLKMTANKVPREAAERLRALRKQTFNRITQAKELAAAEAESRQVRQKNNLVNLKQKLDEQKEVLLAARKRRQERAAIEQRALEWRREQIFAAGGNPFVLERLEEKEKSERLAQQRQILLEEETMQQLEAEYIGQKKSEERRRKLREELNKLWKGKAKERRRLEKKQEKVYFEDLEAVNMARYKAALDLSFQIPGLDDEKKLIFNFDLLVAESLGQNYPALYQSSCPEETDETHENGLVDEEEETKAQAHGLEEQEPLSNLTNCFRISPEQVIFKDFELHKTYKKKVVVSNRTNQRLRFYLREFKDSNSSVSQERHYAEVVSGAQLKTDEAGEKSNEIHAPRPSKRQPISDVVEVTFDPPKPIFPGLTHEFFLTFTPKSFDDWEGELHFDSPAGPFLLPVKCFQKRFSPTLSTNLVTFANVIGGTSATIDVKLMNHGALAGNISHIGPIKENQIGIEGPNEVHSALPITDGEATDSGRRSDAAGSDGKSVHSVSDLRKRKSRRKTKASENNNDSKKQSEAALVFEPTSDVALPAAAEAFKITIKESTNRISPNGHVTLQVTFLAQMVSFETAEFEIRFDDPDIPALKLHVEASSTENPFKADPLNTNMKICLMNVTYQQPVEVRNLSKGSGQIVPRIPQPLRPFVEVSPKVTRSFSGTPSLFSVKFSPRIELFEIAHSTTFLDPESKILDFPVSFHFEEFPFAIPGPLTCTFQAILDHHELLLQPTGVLNFGICSTTETVRKKLTVTNSSAATSNYGFVEMPNWISIQPNHGFGTLLPGESRAVDVLVSPPTNMVGKQQVTLKLRTLENNEYNIPLKAIGRIPMIALKYSQILFPVTSIGSSSSAVTEIYIKGSQSKAQRGNGGRPTKFQFLIDSDFPIEISPSEGVIEPGKAQKLLVSFSPDVNDSEVSSHYTELLQRKFEENHGRIQMELTAIGEILATLLSAAANMSGRGSGDAKSRKSGQSNPPNSAQQKVQPRPSVLKSPRPLIIRNMDDMQLIFSDGTPPSGANQIKELKERQDFLFRALEAKLDPSQPPANAGKSNNLDYMKTRRDLMQNMKTRSTTYTISCRLTLHDGKDELLLLTLKCPMQKPDLVVLDESPVVDFGTVGVGEKRIKEINFYNPGIGPVDLKMDILNAYGPFVRVNALRRLAPNLVFTLRIKFQPTKKGNFEENVIFSGGESKIVLGLTGSGISS